MVTLAVLVLGIGLTILSVLIHYEALRQTGLILPRLPIRPRQRVMVVILGCLIGHLLEVGLYALAIALLHKARGFGVIEGSFAGTPADFLYFSLSSFTTLGIGDIFAHGPLRLLVGIEALNGFLLITWSASFTYLMMQRYWHPVEDR